MNKGKHTASGQTWRQMWSTFLTNFISNTRQIRTEHLAIRIGRFCAWSLSRSMNEWSSCPKMKIRSTMKESLRAYESERSYSFSKNQFVHICSSQTYWLLSHREIKELFFDLYQLIYNFQKNRKGEKGVKKSQNWSS